jgi:hypothetical protein
LDFDSIFHLKLEVGKLPEMILGVSVSLYQFLLIVFLEMWLFTASMGLRPYSEEAQWLLPAH